MVDRRRIQMSFALYALSSTFLFASAILNLLSDNDSSRRCNPHMPHDHHILPPVEEVPRYVAMHLPLSPASAGDSFSQLPIMYRAAGFALTILIGPMLATRIGPGTSIFCVGVLLLPKCVLSFCYPSPIIDSHDFEQRWVAVALSVCSGIGLGFFFALITRQTADIVVCMQNEHGLLASFNPIVSDGERRSIFCAISTLLMFAVAAIPLANGLYLLLHEPFYRTALNILPVLLLFTSICTYLLGLRQHQLALLQHINTTLSFNLSRANLHVIVSDVVGTLVQFMHSYTSRVQKASVLVIGMLAFGFHEVFVYSLLISRCSNGTCAAARLSKNETLIIKNSSDNEISVPAVHNNTTLKLSRLCEFAQTAGLSMGACMVIVMGLCALFAWRGSRRRVHDVMAVVLGCFLLLASYGLMFTALNHKKPSTTILSGAEEMPASFDDGPFVELIMLLFAAGNALLRVTLYALVFNVFQVHVCVGYSICLFLECIACVSWVALSPLLALHWQILLQSLTVLIMLSAVAVLERQDRRLQHLSVGLY